METTTERKAKATTSDRSRRRRRGGSGPIRRFQRRIARTIHWRPILITLLVLFVFVIGFQVLLVSNSANRLQSSFRELQRTVQTISHKSGTDLTLNDFQRLQRSVRDVSGNTRDFLGSAQPVRSVIESLNRDWAASLEALEVSHELLDAAQDMLIGIEPVLFYMVDGQEDEALITQISSGQRIVELMELGLVRFSEANSHLNQARTGLDRIDLAGISQDLLLQVRQLEDYYDQIAEINTVLMTTPDILTLMLGLEQPRSYLILAQNSDELRPSGGYISTYGWMTVRNGRILDYDYFPTTPETPDPPRAGVVSPITVPDWWIQYNQPIYAMWDGSWYADFPQTAEMAMQYYNMGEGNPNRPIHGVIAIDIRGFEMVLQALESVGVNRSIDDSNELTIITPENFRNVIYSIRATTAGTAPHKQFIADVYDAIFSKWQSISQNPEVSQKLFGILLESLRQKHIMIYSSDEETNKVLDELGWSGRQEPAVDHDYLMVADANLGNKSNRSILRQLTYDVTINTDETLTGRVTVSYDYPEGLARLDPAVNPQYHGPIDYSNLAQIFVPESATLTANDNFGIQPFTVNGESHTTFVSRVRVEYNTSERFQVAYILPDLIDRVGPYSRYRLLLQKQPGMQTETVSVQVSLPSSTRLISVTPEPNAIFDIENRILDFQVTLDSDRWVEIIYEPVTQIP